VKSQVEWSFSLLLCLASLRGNAAVVKDGGGRDVSVALFSTLTVHTLTVTPLGEHSWIARCAQCMRKPLTAPLHVVTSTDVFVGGTLRVTADESGEARSASGLWHLRTTGSGHNVEIDVVLTLPSERYVAAVLNAEAAAGEPIQSLRALAILARTYAMNGSHYAAAPGHLAAELCDSTECQAMRLEPPPQVVNDATRATAGETLWFGGRRAEVFFSQNCGGLTEDAGAVWPNLRGTPYLRSHADPYCLLRDTAAWHAEVPLIHLAEIANAQGWRLPARVVSARVAERSASHRAIRVAFTGDDGTTANVSATALRFGIGRALGWDRVRSDAYEVGLRNGALVFDGRGHGHGVGLCQAGSTEMAAKGKSTREILAFYFPGTAVRIAATDEGWQESQVGPILLRTTHLISTERKGALAQAWIEAQRRFSPRHAIMPEITFAPTTEIFRQLTAQPGWALASTHGNTIILQPETVLQAYGGGASGILLHEMLHVLVEAEAREQAPLWLREGLVEVLAGESSKEIRTMSATAIDDALRGTDSLQASQIAHHAAATRVQELISRYGASAVRGWLSSGIPAGVE
jgi:stage II sporulation protein D